MPRRRLSMRCLRDSAWGNKGSIVARLCAGQSAFTLSGIVLFWCQKRTRKPPAIERLGGGEAMKAPVGLSSRQSGLRSKCRVFSTARTGIHEKGAARPFQTPKRKSKRKKASCFAKRFFLVSPIYGFADGFTFLLDVAFSKGVKSAAKQQIGGGSKCG